MTTELAQKQLQAELTKVYENREAANIADLIMAFITGKQRTVRLLDKQVPLSEAALRKLESFTSQLLQNRPVQYVLGECWFAGERLLVNENVLIPRPETEELANWVVTDLQQTNAKGFKLIDIGTGSGCIPLAVHKRIPGLTITAIDISAAALDVAQKNATAWNAGIQFKEIDFLQEENWKALPVFDVITSNPPYIRQSEEKEMAANVLAYEPAIALFVPDDDALLFYRKIARFGHSHLSGDGKIYVEINESLGPEVQAMFEKEGYTAALQKDFFGKDRMLKAIPKP